VLSIDYSLKNIDLNQVYAQAYHLYNKGFQYWLDPKEQAAVEMQNSQFRAKSIEEELIDIYLEPWDGDTGSQKMPALQIQALLQKKVTNARLSHISIGRILAAKGYIQKKSMGITKWVFKEKELASLQVP
jgi:predicted P-loop ATPase